MSLFYAGEDGFLYPGEGGFVPNLASYDVILLNSSAGKDSQCMIDVAVEKADEAGVPRSLLTVVHCDLGRVEWPGAAELAERQAGLYGLRFLKVTRPQGDLLDEIERRGMFPDAANRFCTSHHKTNQVLKIVTRLVNEVNERRVLTWKTPLKKLGFGPVRVLNCMGMRAQESPKRAKKPPFRFDGGASNGKRHVDEWLPLHGWTEEEVWERIRASGVPHHPAYDQGMSRLSCSFCVLASRADLVRAATLRPDLAEEYEGLEARIGHRFKNDLSMREVVELSKKADRGPA